MEPDRILVTGATGFVGRRIVDTFTRSGRALTLALRRDGPLALAGDVRSVMVGDLGPETNWNAALDGVRDVVHLAAHVHVAPERALRERDLFDRVNRAASLALFDAAARHGVRRFAHLSSVTVLGAANEGGRPFDDASPARPETPYAVSKLRAEEELAARAAGLATRLVVLRPPLVCGPGQRGNLASLTRIARWPIPLPLGAIHNRRTLLSLDNLVDAIRAVLDRDAGDLPAGTYLLGDAEPLSTSDIVRHLAAGLGRAPWLVPAPRRLIRAAATALGRGGIEARLFGDLEVDSSRFRQAFAWHDVIDTATSLAAGARSAAAGR